MIDKKKINLILGGAILLVGGFLALQMMNPPQPQEAAPQQAQQGQPQQMQYGPTSGEMRNVSLPQVHTQQVSPRRTVLANWPFVDAHDGQVRLVVPTGATACQRCVHTGQTASPLRWGVWACRCSDRLMMLVTRAAPGRTG